MDNTTVDTETQTVKQSIIAIDALVNASGIQQFLNPAFTRDLNKAYIGFSVNSNGVVATGNWGCGAFGGDQYLKAFQQMYVLCFFFLSLKKCCGVRVWEKIRVLYV